VSNSTSRLYLGQKYHDAILEWQKKNFSDLDLLDKYWDKHFPNDEKFELCAKINKVRNEKILQGKYAGQKKFSRAKEMKGSMLYQALRIIKAQCSTELGSIQQHAETVNASHSDYTKFSVMRIMAEELRHAYQMFWVLSHDESWASTGDKKITDNLMDELLEMSTGGHVLDAFNIEFTDALDNIAFACFIDRVGKFQLTMQEEFAYEPMSASMKPMLVEEAFHLKTGWEVLREIAISAALGQSSWSLDDIQKKINIWYPRALEMFGNSEGGESNLQFSFKTISNREAIHGYISEVESLMQRMNVQILMAVNPGLSKEEARRSLEQSSPLYLPSEKFLRIRSTLEDNRAHQVYDVKGKKIGIERYADYLKTVLPINFFSTEFCKNYMARTLGSPL
jgi:1,2-phenylacetyl-CoA epoxidase catalytic subunit